MSYKTYKDDDAFSKNENITLMIYFFTIGIQQQQQYSKLAVFAQDLLSTPASQAYVERIFSMYVLLTL